MMMRAAGGLDLHSIHAPNIVGRRTGSSGALQLAHAADAAAGVRAATRRSKRHLLFIVVKGEVKRRLYYGSDECGELYGQQCGE